MQPTRSTGDDGAERAPVDQQPATASELATGATGTELDRPAGPKAGKSGTTNAGTSTRTHGRRRRRRVRETPDGQLVFYL